MAKILVIADVFEGKIRKATFSSVTFAHNWADAKGGDFDIAVLGDDVDAVADQLKAYGAAKVWAIKGADLKHYLAAPYAQAVAEVIEKSGADAVCGSATTMLKDLLPRVAVRLGAGMVSNVLSLVQEGGNLYFKRPMWADNAYATVAVKTSKAVFSVRATEFEATQAGPSASPVEILPFTAAPETKKAGFVNFDANVSERPELTEAEVIVTGGRGLTSSVDSLEEKKKLFYSVTEPLADLFNAGIGGTRLVVDENVLANDLQVGQTGKVVAPKLYFAIALSGAIQHIAGMKNSKTIVAINKDEEAPVFSVADYGLVADAFKAVPELVEGIKKIKAG